MHFLWRSSFSSSSLSPPHLVQMGTFLLPDLLILNISVYGAQMKNCECVQLLSEESYLLKSCREKGENLALFSDWLLHIFEMFCTLYLSWIIT